MLDSVSFRFVTWDWLVVGWVEWMEEIAEEGADGERKVVTEFTFRLRRDAAAAAATTAKL